MAVTVDTFQTAFPEFAPYGFSPAATQFWLDLAAVFISPTIWGAAAPVGQPLAPFDYGVLFYAAHNIAIALQSASAAVVTNPATGAPIGAPGITPGLQTNKTVDKVAVSYDVKAIIEEGAGNWNATSYGRRFARLAKQFGNAPMYIGAGPGAAPGELVGNAWAGPGYPFPGWFAW